MKKAFSSVLEKLSKTDNKSVFLTGDLGFNAFENLQENLGKRFINAGVAEQNMLGVAAGMAHMGYKPWAYSIAPFITLKTVEQVRNDVCHTNLPVKIIGNGGGYGYGIMGATHHVLEDIAILSTLPNLKIFVPAFLEDIPNIMKIMYKLSGPSYLRLSLAPKYNCVLPKYFGTRRINKGKRITVVVLGSLIHNALEANEIIKDKTLTDIWSITEFPLNIPKELFLSIQKSKRLLILEEHRKPGGMGEKILSLLSENKIILDKLIHSYAHGYPSGLYGSQLFHLKENELDYKSILRNLRKMI